MEVKPWFQDLKKVFLSPEKMCPFSRSNMYKDLINIFPGTNFVVPELRCPKEEIPLHILYM